MLPPRWGDAYVVEDEEKEDEEEEEEEEEVVVEKEEEEEEEEKKECDGGAAPPDACARPNEAGSEVTAVAAAWLPTAAALLLSVPISTGITPLSTIS
jgi:hypothetical protein